MPCIGKRFGREPKLRVEGGAMFQLQCMNAEFGIDQPAGPKLHIQFALGRFMFRHLGTHRDDILAQHENIAGLTQHISDDSRDFLLGTVYHSCPGQRHMLPGPCVLMLILRKAIKRDAQHALRARGTKSGIDFVKGTTGGLYA